MFLSSPYDLDLIITDSTLPHLTGIDLAGEILTVRQDIPIILCKGFNEKATEAAASETCISELVMKPLDRRQLTDTIRKVLDGNKQ